MACDPDRVSNFWSRRPSRPISVATAVSCGLASVLGLTLALTGSDDGMQAAGTISGVAFAFVCGMHFAAALPAEERDG